MKPVQKNVNLEMLFGKEQCVCTSSFWWCVATLVSVCTFCSFLQMKRTNREQQEESEEGEGGGDSLAVKDVRALEHDMCLVSMAANKIFLYIHI